MAADAQLNIVAKLQDEVSKPLNGMNMSFGKLAGGVAAGLGIYNLANTAFHAMSGFIESSVKAAEESQNVFAQAQAVVKSTGGAAGYTATQLEKLATQFEHTTAFSDEQVLSAENVLATFTKIGHETMPQATKSVLNISTALHEDLQSASIQVGKALQDPVLGMTALRRVGVNFSKDQIEVVKGMVATGHQAQAQQLILKELNTEFGGSASAAANTYAGKMDQLKNNFDDVKEKIGGVMIEGLTPLMMSLANFVNSDRFQRWVEETTKFIKQYLIPAFVGMIKIAYEVGKIMFEVGGFLAKHKEILAAFAGIVLAVVVPAFIAWAIAAATAAISTLIAMAPVLLIGAAIGVLAYEIVTHWKMIATVTSEVWNGIAGFFTGIWNFVSGLFHSKIGMILAIIFPFIGIPLLIITHWNQVVGFFSGLGGAIVRAIGNFAGLLYNSGRDLIQGLINGVNNMIGGVGKAVSGVAKGAVNTIKGLLGIKSPSTVFAEIGANMGAGMVKGLNASMSDVQDAVGNLSGSASASVTVSGNAPSMSSAVTNIYGDIHLQSDSAVEAFFARIGRNQELAAKGVTPVRTV